MWLIMCIMSDGGRGSRALYRRHRGEWNAPMPSATWHRSTNHQITFSFSLYIYI